jgi:hypothetical protein
LRFLTETNLTILSKLSTHVYPLFFSVEYRKSTTSSAQNDPWSLASFCYLLHCTMSEPPPSLPHTGKTKKASRTGGTNVSKKLLMEFQSLIAFACYDSPSIAGGGVAMTEPVMEKLMMKLCFGDNDDDDIVCYADQFLLGLNKFKGLYASGPGGRSPSAVDLGATLEATLTVPPNLHRQGNIHYSQVPQMQAIRLHHLLLGEEEIGNVMVVSRML